MKNRKNYSDFNPAAFGSAIWAGATASPKLSNEGGTATPQISLISESADDPRLVIRGGKFY